MSRLPILAALALLAGSVSACTDTQLQTAATLSTPILQTALSVYAAKHGANPKVVQIGNDVLAALPALEGAYTSNTTTLGKAVAIAMVDVQQLQADDPNATVQHDAPIVLAGLQAVQAGQPLTTDAASALAAMLTAYLAEQS